MKQKLGIHIVVIFLLSVNIASAQSKEVRFLLDTCITIMKENAINTNKVDWDQLQKNALTKASGITNAYKLGPVMRYVYQSVNDFHGSFFYKDSTFKRRRKEPAVYDSVMKEWKKGITIKSKLLEKNVGYLRVPYMSYNGKEDADKNAQKLNDTL